VSGIKKLRPPLTPPIKRGKVQRESRLTHFAVGMLYARVYPGSGKVGYTVYLGVSGDRVQIQILWGDPIIAPSNRSGSGLHRQ
jgi:hypothetical protein